MKQIRSILIITKRDELEQVKIALAIGKDESYVRPGGNQVHEQAF